MSSLSQWTRSLTVFSCFFSELHDSLGAWGGLGASIGSLWRGAYYLRHVTFDVMMVTVFFSAIAILHITTPTVVSVDTIKHPMPVLVNASQVPGHIMNLGYDFTLGGTDELIQALTSVPYLYGQRNVSSTGLPAGLSDT